MSEHLHYVAVTQSVANDLPMVTFECRGGPEAQCHQYPDCECESWSAGHSHPFVPHDRCWLQDWAEVGEGNFVYVGDDADDMHDDGMPRDFPPRTGPITTGWEEEWVEWKWAS